jgi:poly(A) polymerase
MAPLLSHPHPDLELPISNGPDPTPKNGIHTNTSINIPPPPGIEGMKPLSAAVMSSFASAAGGVVEVGNVGQNGGEGRVVLNGAS